MDEQKKKFSKTLFEKMDTTQVDDMYAFVAALESSSNI